MIVKCAQLPLADAIQFRDVRLAVRKKPEPPTAKHQSRRRPVGQPPALASAQPMLHGTVHAPLRTGDLPGEVPGPVLRYYESALPADTTPIPAATPWQVHVEHDECGSNVRVTPSGDIVLTFSKHL